MSDAERRADEMEAMRSIYADEFCVRDERTGCVRISPLLHTDLKQLPVRMSTTLNSDCEKRTIFVKYLPPIELYFQLPDGYPSSEPPYFILDCYWMSNEQLERLADRLRQLWDETKAEIVFVWAMFLQQDCCDYLALWDIEIEIDEFPKSMMPMNIVKFKKLHRLVNRRNDQLSSKPSSSAGSSLGKRTKRRKRKITNVVSENEAPKDLETNGNGRIDQGSENIEITEKLIDTDEPVPKENAIYNMLRLQGNDAGGHVILKPTHWGCTDIWNRIEEHNEMRLDAEFGTETHQCGVCMELKPGSAFVCMRRCRHAFCRECMIAYLQVNALGDRMARCPQNECDNIIGDQQIRELVDQETYEKYRMATLKHTVENDPLLMFCPRELCDGVARVLKNLCEDIGHCEQCDFYFCILCKRTYHGVMGCNIGLEERKKLVHTYRDAEDSVKRRLEKQYGRKQLQKWVENDLSEEWMGERSKKCPNCKASIEKSFGCNKMVCTRCSVPFCWLCMQCLNSDKPYKHFNNPESSCYQKLFPDFDEEEDEEDDDEDDEYEFFDDEEYEDIEITDDEWRLYEQLRNVEWEHNREGMQRQLRLLLEQL